MLSPLNKGHFGDIPHLVGGLEHFLFFYILGMSSSQLTNIPIDELIFFRGVGLNHQTVIFRHAQTSCWLLGDPTIDSSGAQGEVQLKLEGLVPTGVELPSSGEILVRGNITKWVCLKIRYTGVPPKNPPNGYFEGEHHGIL